MQEFEPSCWPPEFCCWAVLTDLSLTTPLAAAQGALPCPLCEAQQLLARQSRPAGCLARAAGGLQARQGALAAWKLRAAIMDALDQGGRAEAGVLAAVMVVRALLSCYGSAAAGSCFHLGN